MVYVPILKIDLPEPRLQELIPGFVTAVLGACTLAFDAVYDLLHPLPPEREVVLYTATLSHLPKEFRKARRYESVSVSVCVWGGACFGGGQQQQHMMGSVDGQGC